MVATNIFPVPTPLSGAVNTCFQALCRWLKIKLDSLTDPPRGRLVLTGNQWCANGAVPAISWATPNGADTYDSQGSQFSAAAPTRLTCQVAGTYLLVFTGWWDTNATGARFHGLLKNGTVYEAAHQSVGNATWYVGGSVVHQMKLAVGDYIECVVYQTSGGSLQFRGDTYVTSFSWTRIGS